MNKASFAALVMGIAVLVLAGFTVPHFVTWYQARRDAERLQPVPHQPLCGIPLQEGHCRNAFHQVDALAVVELGSLRFAQRRVKSDPKRTSGNFGTFCISTGQGPVGERALVGFMDGAAVCDLRYAVDGYEGEVFSLPVTLVDGQLQIGGHTFSITGKERTIIVGDGRVLHVREDSEE